MTGSPSHAAMTRCLGEGGGLVSGLGLGTSMHAHTHRWKGARGVLGVTCTGGRWGSMGRGTMGQHGERSQEGAWCHLNRGTMGQQQPLRQSPLLLRWPRSKPGLAPLLDRPPLPDEHGGSFAAPWTSWEARGGGGAQPDRSSAACGCARRAGGFLRCAMDLMGGTTRWWG